MGKQEFNNMQSPLNTVYLKILKDFENTYLPDPYLLDYYLGLRDNILWIDGEIDSSDLDVIKKIYYWNKKELSTPAIRLYFNSPGGCLETSLAIAQAVKDSKIPVIGYNVGACCSGAALIYSQCDIREASDSAYWLVHKGSANIGPVTYQQSREYQKHYDHLIHQMSLMISEMMGISIEEYDKNSNTEWYLYNSCHDGSLNDAKKYNFVGGDK